MMSLFYAWKDAKPFAMASLLMALIGALVMKLNISFILSWNLLIIESMSIPLAWLSDQMNLHFNALMLLISMSAMMFSHFHMKEEKKKFYLMLTLFTWSMITFVSGGSLIFIWLGWTGVGVTSLWLVMFFQRLKNKNGDTTLFTSRVGDAFFILGLAFMTKAIDWAIPPTFEALFIMMFIGAVTKSARGAFSSRLPKAMVPPNPISALVHLSTLAPTGIFLVMRFFPLLPTSMSIKSLTSMLGTVTLLITVFYSHRPFYSKLRKYITKTKELLKTSNKFNMFLAPWLEFYATGDLAILMETLISMGPVKRKKMEDEEGASDEVNLPTNSSPKPRAVTCSNTSEDPTTTYEIRKSVHATERAMKDFTPFAPNKQEFSMYRREMVKGGVPNMFINTTPETTKNSLKSFSGAPGTYILATTIRQSFTDDKEGKHYELASVNTSLIQPVAPGIYDHSSKKTMSIKSIDKETARQMDLVDYYNQLRSCAIKWATNCYRKEGLKHPMAHPKDGIITVADGTYVEDQVGASRVVTKKQLMDSPDRHLTMDLALFGYGPAPKPDSDTTSSPDSK